MTTTSIKYRLARPGGEYNALYAMMKRRMGEKQSLGWPTVVAEENGKQIGFLSTIPDESVVIAGPLVIDAERRPFVFMRLVEAYENVLRAAGVTEYLFTVPESQPEHLARVRAVVGEPLRVTSDGYAVFKRKIT